MTFETFFEKEIAKKGDVPSFPSWPQGVFLYMLFSCQEAEDDGVGWFARFRELFKRFKKRVPNDDETRRFSTIYKLFAFYARKEGWYE